MTTVVPEVAIPSSEKLVDAIRDHTKETERELTAARTEIAQLNRQLDSTTNEATLLREQLAAKTKAFDAMQGYATALSTKLDVIVDVIGGAKAEAMKFGAKRSIGTAEADTEEHQIPGTPDIADILSRLPRNDLRN